MPARHVVVVGSGRMGTALRRAVHLPPRALTCVAARRFLAKPRRPAPGAMTWVLAVRDGQLDDACAALAPVIARGDVVLHLAGMLGPDVLVKARDAGARVASMHPLIAVAAGNRGDVARGGAFLLEGDRAAVAEGRRLARAAGGVAWGAGRVDRACYHSAAALVATGAVALAQGATELLVHAVTPSLPERALRAAVASLLRSVASNVEAVGARRALASPLLRNDTRAVALHLTAMARAPEARAVYRAALAQVLVALEQEQLVLPDTLASARALLAARD